MKHLLPYYESISSELNMDINHILNIARDEGLQVTTLSDCYKYGIKPPQYYIDRYPVDIEGGDIGGGGIGTAIQDPILSNERFFSIVKEIYDRLKSNDLLDNIDDVEYNVIYTDQKLNDTRLSNMINIEKFTLNKNIKFAGISVIDN